MGRIIDIPSITPYEADIESFLKSKNINLNAGAFKNEECQVANVTRFVMEIKII